MGKRWIFAPLLAAAVAGPPLLMHEEGKNTTGDVTQSASFPDQFWQGQNNLGLTTQIPGESPAIAGLSDEEAALLDPNRITYSPGAIDFREAFRFDANPQWLQKNWPHVSSSPSLDGYAGYRVPLVTGPNPQDITGALTYYFNNKGLCERITFYGYAADPSRIIHLATETFGLSASRDLGSGTYTGMYSRRVRSFLAIDAATNVVSQSAQKKAQITFEVNNPKGKFMLSPEVSRIVESRATTQQASFRR